MIIGFATVGIFEMRGGYHWLIGFITFHHFAAYIQVIFPLTLNSHPLDVLSARSRSLKARH
jgi:hypothetical protein